VEKLRVVQISDIHFSRLKRCRISRKNTDIISGLEPDILVSTGDLIDDGLREQIRLRGCSGILKQGMEKYAATGNHEIFCGHSYYR
jgi:predicted MPP superfamily phosphohydrolase